MKRRELTLSVAGALALALSASLYSSAQAQTATATATTPDNASAGQIEEVIVTSQRRAENIQTVPLSVSAFTPQMLQTRQINDTLDLAAFIPGMVAHNNTGLGSANTYYIRGLGNTESIATFDPAVGTYVDDVYIARQNLNNFGLFDVDRIEVDRGPQGVTFGRNTTGGAIDIILKKPSPEFGGYAEAGYGKYGDYNGRASIDIPITDQILTKFSFFGDHSDGSAHDVVTNQQLNYQHLDGFRGAVRLLPTDDVTWDISGDYIFDNAANVLTFINDANGERVSHSGFTQGGLAGLGLGTKGDFGPFAASESWAGTSNLEWRTKYATINLITGYRQTNQNFAQDFFDYSGSAAGGFNITNLGHNQQWSNELKATGSILDGMFNYVAGYYFFREDSRTNFADIFDTALLGIPGPPTPLVLSDRTLSNSTYANAVYTQWDYHPTSEITLTAGARFTDEIKSFGVESNPNPQALGQLSTAGVVAAGIEPRQHVGLLTPRFAAQYQYDKDLMFYASITRGFKSGGWNARGESSAADTSFRPEKIWSEEVGMKSSFLDNRLRLNITGYYAYDEQIQIPSEVLIGGVATFNTTNPADMEIYGGEFELTYLPPEIPGLSILGALGVQHADYQNVSAAVVAQQAQCVSGVASACNAGFVDSTGNVADPVRVPDYTFALTATYNWDTGPVVVSPTATVNVLGPHAIGTAGDSLSTSDPKAYVGDQITFDMGMTLTPEAYPNISFTAECKNCMSKDYPVSLLPPNQYLNNPGIWDVKVRYKFMPGESSPEPAPPAAAPVPAPPPAPPAPPASAPEPQRAFQVFFDFDKSNITDAAASVIQQAAASVKAGNHTQIAVTGHTDTVGSVRYNQRLSERRAEAVKKQLIADGVGGSDIATKGVGKTELLVPTPDGVREPQNRRAEIVQQ